MCGIHKKIFMTNVSLKSLICLAVHVQNVTYVQYTVILGSIYFDKFSLVTVQTGKFANLPNFSMTNIGKVSRANEQIKLAK